MMAELSSTLSGLPYWGTDIGGFVPTADFTGELFVRWFQFGAFNPLFRSHGRTWHLRLPWGWNTGELGFSEVSGYTNGAQDPPASELHNAAVEPICKQYLELRYRLMPYLYTAVRECHDTGLPILRAMWLHHADEPAAVARGDQYLWGRDILVAPVVEKGATSRTLHLPKGTWIDFWTERPETGGREITLTDSEVSEQDIDQVVSQVSEFGEDNRAGIPRITGAVIASESGWSRPQ